MHAVFECANDTYKYTDTRTHTHTLTPLLNPCPMAITWCDLPAHSLTVILVPAICFDVNNTHTNTRLMLCMNSGVKGMRVCVYV